MPGPEDIKAQLKEAKTALKNQEYEACTRACRLVLRVSPDNYNALVLEGAALQHLQKYNQSLAAFKKAAAICPNSLLAYQGIVSHYEKQNIQKHDDLLEAYKNISRFYETDKDEAKFIETTLKFAGALQSQGDFVKCINVLARLIKSRGNNIQIAQMAIGALTQIKDITPDQESLLLSCLGVLHETNASSNDQYRKYFQLLYKQGQFSKLEAVCLDLQPKFNSFYYPIDYLCRLFLEKNVSENTNYIMPNFVDQLFKLYPSSTFGYFAQGKILLENGKVLDAISWLKQGLESKVHQDALELLVTALLSIWDFEGVEEHATRALKLPSLRDPGLFYNALAHSYIGQQKFKEASTILDQSGSELQQSILKAKILAGEHRWNELDAFLLEMQKFDHWEFDFLRARGKRAKLLSLCELYKNNFNLLLLCGIELSKLDDFETAINVFGKCLELFPKHPSLQTYLAGFYRLEGENETALKYLLSAYDALPSQEIGIMLSDLYFDIGDSQANKELLKKAASKSKKSKSKWAWLRLGMIHLELGESDDAVVALQAAIRTDYSDCNLWETLADAYYSRGSYEAALKTFNRAIQLGAEPTYPKLKMGVIYEHLGEGDLALSTLSELGDYAPALLEIAKSWLLIAGKKFNEGLSMAVVDAVEESIKAATRVIQSSEQALALTIISEACLIGGDLNPESACFRVPRILVNNQESVEQFEMVNSRQLITIGINSASLILKNFPSKFLAGFQHSLLAKLYYRLTFRHSSTTFAKALYHAKKAVSLDPTNYTYWNLVGIMAEACGEDSLAQHALIKSISLNSTGNAVAWTNLGFLALHHKERLKAHSCFAEAQRFQPSYGLCWIGQGMVAGTYNPEESTDITRHASSLDDTHIYAGLFYANGVCRALETPDKNSANFNYFMEHLDSAHVSLEKIALFNIREPTVTSLNLEGILRMHTGQYTAALKIFERATEMTQVEDEIQILTRNRITALQRLGKYEESLKLIQTLSNMDFQAKAAAALALHKSGSDEHAFQFYGGLVDICESDQSKKVHQGSALIAQGISAHRLGDLETAMTLLFRGSELSSTPEGHIALCSIALVSGNLDFAESVVAEMNSKCFGQNQDYLDQIAVLNAFCLYGQGFEKKAVRSILSHIHMYPRNGKLWNVLSHYLINVDENGRHARHALLTAHRIGEALTLPGVALTHLLDSNFEEALKQAQIALAHNPTSLPALAAMTASLSYNNTPSNNFLNRSIQLARKALEITESECQNLDLYTSIIRDWFHTYMLHYMNKMS